MNAQQTLEKVKKDAQKLSQEIRSQVASSKPAAATEESAMTKQEKARIVQEINERLAKKKEKAMNKKKEKVEAVPSSSIVRDVYKKVYLQENGDYICGDDLSVALKAATTDERGMMSLDALRKIARENGFTMDSYLHLNRGQIRMNIGNKLRGKLQHGEVVKINGRKLKARK